MSAPPRSTIPTLATLPLELATRQLRLTPYTLDDVDALWPHVSDPRLPVQMSWSAHESKDETRTFVAGCIKGIADNTGVVWAIRHAGELVGAIGLHGLRFQVAAWRIDRAELGY